MKEAFAKPFGVRRLLDPQTSRAILSAVAPLLPVDERRGRNGLRPRLHSTLLPQRSYSEHVHEGRLKGQSLVVVRGQMERKTRGRNEREVEAVIGKVSVHQGKQLIIELKSEGLHQDTYDIERVLGRFGVKGLRREGGIGQLHSTIADLTEPLSPRERLYLVDATAATIDDVVSQMDVLSDEPPLIFGGWQVYPDPEKVAMAA